MQEKEEEVKEEIKEIQVEAVQPIVSKKRKGAPQEQPPKKKQKTPSPPKQKAPVDEKVNRLGNLRWMPGECKRCPANNRKQVEIDAKGKAKSACRECLDKKCGKLKESNKRKRLEKKQKAQQVVQQMVDVAAGVLDKDQPAG